mgnify:FL=1
MAILGKIRQRSVFLILVIGLALFAFVISGVFGNGNQGANATDPVAVINDDEIDIEQFRAMVDQAERNYNFSTIQAVNVVWDQAIRSKIFEQELNALGIDAGREQIEQIVSGNQSFVQDARFQNEAGFFDFGIFTNFIAQLKTQNPTAYEQWKSQERSIIEIAKQNIYYDLIKASSGLTEAEARAAFHLENDNLNLKYVRVPFDFVDDSLVSISQSEIKAYRDENKDQYQRDSYRNIQYVKFENAATEEDISSIRLRLEGLIDQRIAYNNVSKLTDTLEGLKTTKQVADFVDEFSEQPFDSVYKPKGILNNEYADIIFGLNQGEVFGPYQDGNFYKISRMLDKKKNASIRASHILIPYDGASRVSEDVTRTAAEARKEARRIYRFARRRNANFEDLAREFSEGPSKSSGGDLGFFQEGEMAAPFFEFCDAARVGAIGVVETEFGFHVVKVTDKNDLALIADVIAAIVPSDKTSNEIFRNATQFEMDALESDDFLTTAENTNYEVQPVNNIAELEENLPGLFQQRNIVKWAFDSDTKLGAIRRFTLSDGSYAVVQLTAKQKEGLAELDEVESEIRAILIKKKKAELIVEQFEAVTTLEELAEKTEQSVETASAINQSNATLVGSGEEPYILGAAFSLPLNAPSVLMTGEEGVYKIEVTQKNIAQDIGNYDNYAKNLRDEANKQLDEIIFEALKSAASIEDNRVLYY